MPIANVCLQHRPKSTFGVHYRTGSPGQLGLRVAGFPGHWVAGSQNVTKFHVSCGFCATICLLSGGCLVNLLKVAYSWKQSQKAMIFFRGACCCSSVCRLLACRTRCAVASSRITCWRNRASVHRTTRSATITSSTGCAPARRMRCASSWSSLLPTSSMLVARDVSFSPHCQDYVPCLMWTISSLVQTSDVGGRPYR